MLEDSRALTTATQVAQYLGVGVGTVYAYAQEGVLPCVRIGDRLIRFRWADIEAFVRSSLVNGDQSRSDPDVG